MQMKSSLRLFLRSIYYFSFNCKKSILFLNLKKKNENSFGGCAGINIFITSEFLTIKSLLKINNLTEKKEKRIKIAKERIKKEK